MFEEATSELSFGLPARTAVEISCGGGVEGHWTRASVETITLILGKPSNPSLSEGFMFQPKLTAGLPGHLSVVSGAH